MCLIEKARVLGFCLMLSVPAFAHAQNSTVSRALQDRCKLAESELKGAKRTTAEAIRITLGYPMSFGDFSDRIKRRYLSYYHVFHEDGLFYTVNPFKKIVHARVVFLGEDHTNSGMQAANQAVLSKMYRPGDIILMEGIPGTQQERFPELESRFSHLHDAIVLGWDDSDLLDNAIHAVHRMRKEPSSAKLQQEWSTLVTNTPNKFLSLLYDSAGCESPWDKSALHLIHVTGQKKWDDFYFIKRVVKNRNEAMETQIKKVMKDHPKSRIYVVAGSEHFNLDPELQFFILDQVHGVAFIPRDEAFKWTEGMNFGSWKSGINDAMPHDFTYLRVDPDWLFHCSGLPRTSAVTP